MIKNLLLFKLYILFIVLSLLLGACGPSPSASIAKSDLQRVTAPDTPPDDILSLVENNNAFAFELYRS